MTKKRVVVTGVGIIASNGCNRESFFESICAGKTGLKSSKLAKNMKIDTTVIAGEVDDKYIKYKDFPDEEKSIIMAYQAIDEAMTDSQLTKADIYGYAMRCGLSISTTVARDSNVMKYIRNKKSNGDIDSNWLIDSSDYSAKIAKYVGVRGPTYTTVSACAAGTAGAAIAIDHIRNDITDVVVVVGMDMIAEISVVGFLSLNSMSKNGCVPFSKDRDGTSLGEGAVAFIVESLDHALQREAHIYGELLGYGLGNDAYHITSPDSDGANRTMRMALMDANIDKWKIDYINTHGTATNLNDSTEIEAISKLYDFEKTNVMISSTKAVTGHCLGAAGSVELAVILLSVDRGIVPPTANLIHSPDEFSEFNLVKEKAVKADIHYALSNSFAFSGNSASLVVAKFSL